MNGITGLTFALHHNDLPDDVTFGNTLAIDGEFMGLNVWRDRLCLLQIYDGEPDSLVHIVKFEPGKYAAPHLRRLLSDATRRKLYFYARGDMRWIAHYLGIVTENATCLRIASRIARTYTQSHNLDDVCRQVLGIKVSKEQQCTDWGAESLSDQQLDYACKDVLYLHALDEKLSEMMRAENRLEIAQDLYKCLPSIVRADLRGWMDEDLFGYAIPKA